MAKVKSHRGEPVNEYADVTANKGRQASDDSAQWNEASGRLVFTVKKGNGVRHSTWRAGIKKAIKEKAGKWEVQRQLQEAIRKRTWHATGGASIRHERKLGFPRWWAATKQEQEIYTSKKFLDDTWGRTCFDWLQETIPNQKAGTTWTTWCARLSVKSGSQQGRTNKMVTQQKCDMEEKTSVNPSHHTHISVQQMALQDWKQVQCRVCFMRTISTESKLRCKTENSDRHLWAHSKCGMPGNQGGSDCRTQ